MATLSLVGALITHEEALLKGCKRCFFSDVDDTNVGTRKTGHNRMRMTPAKTNIQQAKYRNIVHILRGVLSFWSKGFLSSQHTCLLNEKRN